MRSVSGVFGPVVVAIVSAVALAGAVAGTAQAEPRYHWCPGEQWSGWMGANWDTAHCHDNHYIDLQPRDAAHWRNGEFDPNWPAPAPPCVTPVCANSSPR